MKLRTVILLLPLFIAGCFYAPIYQTELEAIEISDSLDPIELTPDFDPYLLRIDLIRQTRCDGNDDTQNVNYSRLGFRLGNGLFFDYNNNLSILIPELFGIVGLENFSIEDQFNNNIYTKADDNYTSVCRNWFGTSRDALAINHDENQITLGKRWWKTKINQTDEELKINGCRIITTGTGYKKGRRRICDQYYRENNEIVLNHDYVIRESGDRIEILNFRRNPAKRCVLYTIQRKENAIYFTSPVHRGFKLTQMDNGSIVVEENRRMIGNYVIVD